MRKPRDGEAKEQHNVVAVGRSLRVRPWRTPRGDKVQVMKRAVSVDSVIVAAKDQVSSDLGGEVAILDLKAGMYYGLDEVGAHIWELVQKPTVVSEIQVMIIEQYDVETMRAERDVLAFLQRLADEGLIEVRDEAPA
jgi:hypothetical protein